MYRALFAGFAAVTPFTAMAHEGHGGFGLFHHAMDLMPLVVVTAIAWSCWRFINKR